ncbi:MAG: hypothetical protein ABI145_02860 [Steroidobacteraceae bacterium]
MPPRVTSTAGNAGGKADVFVMIQRDPPFTGVHRSYIPAGGIKTMRVLAVLLSAVLASACGKHEPGADINPATDQGTQTYGYGPVPNPRVTYQPAVIVVGGGPRSVRSASADGTVWIIDGSAEHAKDLVPGKVMLLTSRAAGRVMAIERQGNDLKVTLGPMQFGELVRDADFNAEVPVDVGNLMFQAIPDLPGMYRDLTVPAGTPAAANDAPDPPVRVHMAPVEVQETPGEILLRLLPIRVAAANNTNVPTGNLPQATTSAPSVSVGGFEVELSRNKSQPRDAKPGSSVKDRIGLKISHGTAGLKAGIDIGLWVSNLTFRTHTVYSNGKPDEGASSIVVDGIEGLDMDIATGIAKAIGDNKKVRIEVPIELVQQVPPAITDGIPLVFQVKFKFLFETALGGNNATLSAIGKYDFKGSMGIENGKLVTPEVTETSPIIDAISGVSLGVSAIVFTQETRVLFGLGIPATFTGPYAKFTTAVGMTKASDLSASMAPICRSSTLKFDMGAGWGIQLTVKEADALTKLLGVKGEWEVLERSATFYRKDFFKPDIKMCRL